MSEWIPKNSNEELNETKKIIQDVKEEFNIDIKIVKKKSTWNPINEKLSWVKKHSWNSLK
jgi:hypothetical protein